MRVTYVHMCLMRRGLRNVFRRPGASGCTEMRATAKRKTSHLHISVSLSRNSEIKIGLGILFERLLGLSCVYLVSIENLINVKSNVRLLLFVLSPMCSTCLVRCLRNTRRVSLLFELGFLIGVISVLFLFDSSSDVDLREILFIYLCLLETGKKFLW